MNPSLPYIKEQMARARHSRTTAHTKGLERAKTETSTKDSLPAMSSDSLGIYRL